MTMDDKNKSALDLVEAIRQKISSVRLPDDLSDKALQIINQLQAEALSPEVFWRDYQINKKYLDTIIKLPFFSETKDILDLNHAKEKLDSFHYGLDDIKERVLEYISIFGLQQSRQKDFAPRAPIFLFSGLAGTGKTTMAKAIATTLGRKFIRIPFGGLGDPFYLRGQSRFYQNAHMGAIMKNIIQVNSNNPVILLDEIDRIAESANSSIMGVLIELLDPEQNHHFVDSYLDHPFDLSHVIFCATCNNTNRLATAVLDRLEPIQMPSYSDEEKIVIGQKYIFPKVLSENSLYPQDIVVSPEVWPLIVRPLGFDAGVRTLKRNIESMCRKAAYLIFQRKMAKVIVNESNLKQFISQW
jgi:ATP-dependent Lon protease